MRGNTLGEAGRSAPVANVEGVRPFLVSAIPAARERSGLTVIAVPAPAGPPEALFRVCEADPAFLWNPPHGAPTSALGAVDSRGLSGMQRFGQLRTWADALWPRMHSTAFPGCPSPRLRLFGGFGFRPGDSTDPPWEPFGDGRFILPRWCYSLDDGRGILQLAVAGDPAGQGAAELLAEFDAIRAALGRPEAEVAHPRVRVDLDEMPREEWIRLVQSIRRGIDVGRYRKIVLARRSIARLARSANPSDLLLQLDDVYPDCYRFAVRLGSCTFLGASPERLVRKRGPAVQADAMAGSMPMSADASAAEYGRRSRELVADHKETSEHQLVVDTVREKLAPLCLELDCPETPQVLRLRHVMHIRTPIAGRLRQPRHVLDLVETLHPTPAVGGVPTDEALRWITENESVSRGWYAGPVGWIDNNGDGEFAVALRCGVFRDQTAFLYAGSGIVEESDPVAEYEETALKQWALLSVLGGRL